ncbi:hypothetical protein [Rhodobium gokarnense]|uniref:Uncharacterized protein n=1 Tax=Rhodobium gokarnense TaxID=364296 RepID=A0ABT3HIZ4_9HYPH|nr:hypothetical protein [Rhodobium gokarnense]MCW2310279.1 hypothetical protein [Rhodobium gokarnense]
MALNTVKILREEWEVDPRLAELHTDKEKLLRVRAIAIGAAADATPFHPANAAGTFSYQHGTFALRNEHDGKEGWESDRPNGVEAIKNEGTHARVVFANVDIACSDAHEPKPRSAKGAGAERLCAGNDDLFGGLPRFVDDGHASDGWITFYLMVAPNGAAELSRATVEHGQFKRFVERIYLSDGSDLDAEPVLMDDDVAADQFDPQVVRK